MPRSVLPLVNTQILNAKPKDKEYSLADGQGLLLRIRPNGSKNWLFNYTHPITKKRKNISIGSYPDISLLDARVKAGEYRANIGKGQDPKTERERSARLQKYNFNNNFELIARQWIEFQCSERLAPKYVKEIKHSLENYVFPVIGKCPINELTAHMAIEALKPVAAKGSLETVRRLCQRVNAVMFFAMSKDYIQTNRLEKISKSFNSPVKKNLPAIKPEELPELMKALSIARIKLVTRLLIEWQLHTMVRPGEACCAEWTEIDLENKTWTISSSKMKMKGRPDHIIPLTRQSIELLNFIKPLSGHRRYIFPSDKKPQSHMNAQTATMALKRMGFHSRLVAHGLRSIASTALYANMFEPHVIEACLAHVDSNSTSAAYNRTDYLNRRRVLMEWWSDYIERAANGNVSMSSGIKHIKLVNE